MPNLPYYTTVSIYGLGTITTVDIIVYQLFLYLYLHKSRIMHDYTYWMRISISGHLRCVVYIQFEKST